VLEFDNKNCIIIDSGYATTYEHELRPLLLRLREKGCRVILLLVTHIDQDHIEGAIRLIAENGKADNSKIIPIDNIWFNGFFNTLFKRPEFDTRRATNLRATTLKQRDTLLKELRMQNKGDNGLISASQSMDFEQLCAKNGYHLNQQFADRVVRRLGRDREAVLSSGISIGDCLIYVLGPTDKQLDKLACRLDVEMIRSFGTDYKIIKDEAFGKLLELMQVLIQSDYPICEREIAAPGERLKSWIGTSSMAQMNEINRASIVIEIVYKGIKMLFCGDAESADWADIIAPHYHLIKLSHHGTTKPNTALLAKSKGDILLISTNGGQNCRHPEDELLAQAILAGNRTLHHNYDINRKSLLLAMQKKYGFVAQFGEREVFLRREQVG